MLNRSLYLFASKLAGYGVRLVLPYFLVRLLSVAEFGAYRQFFLLEIYISTLFQLGLNQALYYFIPRDVRNAGAYFLNSILANIVVFSLAFTGLGFFSAPLSRLLNMPILHDSFGLLVANVLIMILVVGCDCFLTAREHVKASAAFEVSGQVLLSIVSVVAAFLTRDLGSILTALVVARALQLVAMLAYIQWRLHGFRAERYFFGIGEQLKYGVVLGASGALLTVLMKFNEFFVSRYYGAEGFAVYSAGCTDLPFVRMFTQSVAVVALGQFAQMEQQNDWEGMRRLWRRVLTSSYATALPFMAILLLVSKPLVIFMFTERYADAVPIFQVATLLKIALVFNATLVLRAIDRNDVSIWVNVGALVAAPFLLYGGMKAGGMVGIISAQAVILVGSRVLGVYFMNRILPVRMPYFVSIGDLVGFYREAGGKLREGLRSRRGGRLPAGPAAKEAGTGEDRN